MLCHHFYLYVDDVDQVFANALLNGCRQLEAPHIDFLGDHKARLIDIFGYIWDVAAKM
jgi:PhnB protein